MRRSDFFIDEYYHIYNRGVDGRRIFKDDKDFVRFIIGLRELNNKSTADERDYWKRTGESAGVKPGFGYPKPGFVELPPLVEIVCYCLNPNHYHLLLKQKQEKGIEKFMHRLGISYTKYYNYRYKRKGHLFQNVYQSIPVKLYSHLLKLMIYIDCNSEIHGICAKEKWIWSSFLDYAGLRNGTLCDKSLFEQEFKNSDEFISLCNEIIPEIKAIKSILLE